MGKVIDIDKGYKKAMKSLKALGIGITVGIHADAKPYQRGQESPANVAQIASVHEFGGGNVPMRATFRPTLHGNQARYAAIIQVLAGKVIDGTLTAKQMGDQLGAKVASDIQNAMTALVDPPLAASTIAAKKKTAGLAPTDSIRLAAGPLPQGQSGAGIETGNPLIDTGHMRQSVTWKTFTGLRKLLGLD